MVGDSAILLRGGNNKLVGGMVLRKNVSENVIKPVLSGTLAVVLFLLALTLSGMLPSQKYSFLTGDGFTQVLLFPNFFTGIFLRAVVLSIASKWEWEHPLRPYMHFML